MVFNLQRCSVHDGPGIRTTVFLKGCPLRCAWCHNPEGIDPRPELMINADRCLNCGACSRACPVEEGGAAPAGDTWVRSACTGCGSCAEACPTGARELMGRSYSVSELVDEVARDRAFFEVSGGGVTFSGGEPLAQPSFLEAVLLECRERGLRTAVDTCGFAPSQTAARIAALTDLVLFDLKHMDSVTHEHHTGVGNQRILENLRHLCGSAAEVWIRIPLIPGFNDDDGNVEAAAAFVAALPRRCPVFVLPYHGIARGKAERLGRERTAAPDGPPGAERLAAIRSRLESFGLEVNAGGKP